MKDVKRFLTNNGFKKVRTVNNSHEYVNDYCVVVINENNYEVFDKDASMFSTDHNIYWLIGVLTYYGMMDRNYKDNKEGGAEHGFI